MFGPDNRIDSQNYILAGVENVDFNATAITLIFESNEHSDDRLRTSVMLFDDDVNEAEEVFVVLLELVSAENPDKVDLSQRKASLCRIGDDDCECLWPFSIVQVYNI